MHLAPTAHLLEKKYTFTNLPKNVANNLRNNNIFMLPSAISWVFPIFRDNFLNLDIYYKQLSVEEILQQPAFEFLSLLSEVGGFLGLLLGASVLTVCEIFDFIIVTIGASCSARTIRKKGSKEDNDSKTFDAEQQNGQKF